MSSLEQKINYQLNKYPAIKKNVKRIYQHFMYAMSKKVKVEGNIVRLSPSDGYEYFFGYYDKSPWDVTDRYVLCLRAKDTWSDVSPRDVADIILIDTMKAENDEGRIRKILDFSRLYNLRPGYGYYNVPEITKGIGLPDAFAIWSINLQNNEITPLLKYADFAMFSPREEMADGKAVHKVNHLMLSPNGKRFMVLYRWFNRDRKYTRLITCNIDGCV